MAGAAGLSVPHVFHGRFIRTALGLKQVGMTTVAALEHLNVGRVRESDVTSFFVPEEDVAGMTFGAVSATGYAESIGAVMTGAAGYAVLHVFHICLVRAALSLEQVGMTTVAALEHFNVDCMREYYLSDVFIIVENITSVASGTVAFNAECFPAVMAGTAGHASLHGFHADVVAVVLLFEQFRVTAITVGAMSAMTEDDFTDGFGLYVDFVHYTPHSSHSPHTNSIEDRRQGDYQQNDHKKTAF